jgi:secreted trypsin-like serine protease
VITRIRLLAIGLGLAVLLPIGSAAADEPRAHASVVGGRPADPAQWPFMAALVDAGQPDTFQAQFCGGALVAPDAVLTAAHCVTGVTPATLQVVFGAHLDPAQPRVGVAAIVVHPRYDAGAFGRHDLAVVRLAAPVAVPPVALAAPGQDGDGQAASLAGFGNVQGDEANAYPDALQQGDVVLGGGLCARAKYDHRLDVCADTGTSTVTSACDGDSGGPLVTDGRLVGVVSFGPTRCHGESYYTRVSAERRFVARAAGVPAPPPVRPLRLREARGALAPVLRRELGARFTRRARYRAACARHSARRVRCQVGWDAGRTHYAGRVDLWTVAGADGIRALSYTLAISRTRR